MARKRDWNRLAASTRRRYERAGISRRDYMAGADLRRARGHQSTPERPNRKPRPGEEQYWINKLVTENFSNRIKYVGPRDLEQSVDQGEGDFPSLDDIYYATTLDTVELEVLAGQDHWWWLRYHKP